MLHCAVLKLRMLRRYPGTLRWRQALPPAFVLSLILLVVSVTILASLRDRWITTA